MIALGYGLAIVIGLSLGLLGGGGSILTVPVLVYVLGRDMTQAVPMSLVVVGVTSLVGVIKHQRSRNIRWDAVISFAPAAMIGALLGGRLATLVSGRLQLQIFAVLMLAAAASMYLGPSLWTRAGAPVERKPWIVTAVAGGTVGTLTGLVGVGGGFIYVPALVLLCGLPMRAAVGTSLVLIVVSCTSGFVSHLGWSAVDWLSLSIFTGLAMAGVWAGSALCRYVAQEKLRRGFAAFLLVMGVLVFLRPR